MCVIRSRGRSSAYRAVSGVDSSTMVDVVSLPGTGSWLVGVLDTEDRGLGRKSKGNGRRSKSGVKDLTVCPDEERRRLRNGEFR